MRTENTVRNEKRGMISHMRTKKRSIAGIAILVYFLIAVLVVIILKFPDADRITDDSGDVAAVEQGTELLDRYDSQDTTAVENEVRSVRAGYCSAGGSCGQLTRRVRGGGGSDIRLRGGCGNGRFSGGGI